MGIKEEIIKAHEGFIKEYGKNPNLAYVKCVWDGQNEPEDDIQTIVMDGEWISRMCNEDGSHEDCDGEYIVPYIPDEDVLYYCSNLDSLLALTEDNSMTDFKVCEFISFDRE